MSPGADASVVIFRGWRGSSSTALRALAAAGLRVASAETFVPGIVGVSVYLVELSVEATDVERARHVLIAAGCQPN